jgi:hypothetical protein
MGSSGWPAEREPDEEGYPTGIVVGVGAASLVGTACLAALVAHTPGPRLGLLVAMVGLVAAWSANGRAAVTLAVLAWPVGNGFLVNQYGHQQPLRPGKHVTQSTPASGGVTGVLTRS